MKTESPTPRGGPSLANRYLSGSSLRPLTCRRPLLSADHLLRCGAGLGNRLLEAQAGTAGLSTASTVPLRFSCSLSPRLPSALGPLISRPAGFESGQTSPEVEKTQLPLDPPESQDVTWQWDPVEWSRQMPSYNLSAQEYEDLAKPRGASETEELSDVPDPSANQGSRLRRKKESLLNTVCCSLLAEPKFTNTNDYSRWHLLNLCKEVAEEDPEFILKVALYARQELNIRSTANFLLAVGAHLPAGRPHLRRYLVRTVRLPSDWLEVAHIYQSLAQSGRRLSPFPSCLRQALSDSFRSFDDYQLAKYNSRRQRGKSQRGSPGKGGRRTPAQRFTLKKLVQWLHLKEPANHIMCLLGRRYPSDLQSFSRSRLPGPWDSRRAGKRMKLPVPETWERELSRRGNTASVWQQLIDNQKLPYMAALRNLRNMIGCGLSPRHHRLILARLSNKKSVIHSRQLPLRFLAAYRVLAELGERLEHKDDPLPTRQELMQRAVASVRQRQRRSLGARVRPQLSRAGDISYSSLSRQVTRKLRQLQDYRNVQYDQSLLDDYGKALEQAVEISAAHNVPPLPGSTVILCPVGTAMDQPCLRAQDLHLPGAQGPETQTQTQTAAPKLLEMAVLLGLMARHISEHCRLVLFSDRSYREVEVPRGSVLSGVTPVLQEAKDLEGEETGPTQTDGSVSFLSDCVRDHVQIDTLVLLACGAPAREMVPAYRSHVNRDLLFVQVDLSARRLSVEPGGPNCRNDVILYGYSDQILRFLCERGSCRLLAHVEKIDDIFHLPKAQGSVRVPGEMEPTSLTSVPRSPVLRWRTVRVFVSSTFRDMAGERDLLVRAVFPELCARAAPHLVRVQEVDLRWGITEEECRSNRQLELCLSEVSQCQLFVLILGERYGQILDQYSLPDLPQFQWVKDYPRGRSVTELELMQFLRQRKGDARQTCFVYTRDPSVERSVPEQWAPDFRAESEAARLRVAELREEVKERDLLTLENYSSEWGGHLHGTPYLAGLQEFGSSVLRHLWGAVRTLYCQGQPRPQDDHDALQQGFLEAQSSQLFGRGRQLSAAATAILRQKKGAIFLISGRPSEGKTTFLAGLAVQLSPTDGAAPPGQCDVLYHFTGAGEGAGDAAVFLRRLCEQLDQGSDREIPQSYRALVRTSHRLLGRTTRRRRLVVLVDGADRLLGPSGAPTSDWIPQPVPQAVTLVVTVTEDSPLHRTLGRHGQAATFQLGALDPRDRAALVRGTLAVYGKRLDESAFSNQMRLLVAKRESHQPLFLRMATEELRSFGVFEKVSERIRAMPSTLRQMLQWALERLEQEFGAETVTFALCALSVSERGLREGDLYSILCTRGCLRTGGPPLQWEEVMRETAAARRPIAMATFVRLLRSLAGMCGVRRPANTPGSRLRLSGTLLRVAVEQRYLRTEGRSRICHLLLAAHLWRLTDPGGDRTFTNCDPEALADLPLHLVGSGELSLLASLLADLRFSWLHVRLGMLPRLGAAFARCGSAKRGEEGQAEGDPAPFPDPGPFRGFVAASSAVLSRDPLLFWQQALNQPDSSPVGRQARDLLGPEPDPSLGPGPPFLPPDLRLIHWVNKPRCSPSSASRVTKVPSRPECVSLSPSGRRAAVGTSEGHLHLLDLESGQETQSLVSGGDGVSGCVFLSETVLCTTSFDGKLEVWDLDDGCRSVLVDAHSDRISGCAVSPDRKQLATCSWDRALKVWAVPSGTLDIQLLGPCPLGGVTFHPQGQLLAAGGWDHAVRLWNYVTAELVRVFHGQSSSVRSLAFSPAGDSLVSAGLRGDILYWCLSSGLAAGGYEAHRGPVTALRFLDEGRRLLSAGEDQQVRIWSGTLGRRCGELGADGGGGSPPALCLSVSPGGGTVAVGYHSGQAAVFDLRTGERTAECEGPGLPVRCLRWLGGKEFLAVGGDDSLLRVWRLGAGAARCLRTGRGHSGPLLALGGSREFLASASADCTLLLWTLAGLTEAEGGEEVSPTLVLRSHTDAVTCCSFCPRGRHLVTGSRDKSLLFWDLEGARGPTSRPRRWAHRDWVTGCGWGPRYVASCSNDGLVRLWDPETIECVREFKGHTSSLTGVHVTDDFVLSVTRTGELLVWKDSGASLTAIPAHTSCVNSLTVYRAEDTSIEGADGMEGSEGSLRVLTAADDGCVRCWDPLLPEEVATLTHGAVVRGAAAENHLPFFLTVADDQTLRVWDVPRGQAGARDPPTHRSAVTALRFSPSGQLLVSGTRSGEVGLWDSGEMLLIFQPHRKQISAVTFLSEEEFALGSFDGTVSVWMWDPQCRMRLLSSDQLPSPVSGLAHLGDRRLLVSDLSGSLRLLDPGNAGGMEQIRSHRLLAPELVERADGSVLGVEGIGGSRLFTIRGPDVPESEDASQEEERDDETRLHILAYLPPLCPPGGRETDASAWVTAALETGTASGPGSFLLYADSSGSLWRHPWDRTQLSLQSSSLDTHSHQVHSGRVTAVSETEDVIVTASRDRTVRLWDRDTLKQVGLFLCRAPVLCLVTTPASPGELVCGDSLGNVYFLRWRPPRQDPSAGQGGAGGLSGSPAS